MSKPKKLIEIFSPMQEDRDVFFILASEFDMEYKCLPASIKNNDFQDRSEILDLKNKNKFIENEWYVSIKNLKSVLEINYN